MKPRPARPVLIRGGGELASAAARLLFLSGFQVAVLEREAPLAVRRRVSLAEAVFTGSAEVEETCGRLVPASGIRAAWEAGGFVPVAVDPDAVCLAELKPGAVVDGRMSKRVLDTRIDQASLVIGLDLSYESLRHNTDVDVRLYGSATSLPLPAGSMDAIVCFYSLHHLVGQTVHENEALLRAALREFARVLKPGADLLVFEIAPWWLAWKVQRLAWNVARQKLGRSLDMFFWRRQTLTALASELLPPGTRLEYQTIRIPPFTVFPFAFALQRLQLPRLFYPFAISMYDWRVGQIA